MRKKCDQLQEIGEKFLLKNNRRRPVVYMKGWPEPPMASGNWVPEMVKRADGRAILYQKGTPSATYPNEALLKLNP